MIFCPLCLSKSHTLESVQGPDKREYRRCSNCKLIYTATKHQLSKAQEKKRYELHKNGIENAGYVKFLNKAIEPALPYFNNGMKGLDFGCGPVPTLSKILEKIGFTCDEYDPIFFPEVLKEPYDFIFATECFEHFFLPAKELQQIKQLLTSDGYLIIMTERYNDIPQFKSWYYAKDPTHVSFFHKQSFDFICKKYGFKLLFSDSKSVVILQKGNDVEKISTMHSSKTTTTEQVSK